MPLTNCTPVGPKSQMLEQPPSTSFANLTVTDHFVNGLVQGRLFYPYLESKVSLLFALTDFPFGLSLSRIEAVGRDAGYS